MRSDPTTSAFAGASSWALPLSLVALGGLGWACQDGGFGSSGSATTDAVGQGDVSRQDVLSSIAHNVIVPSTADFATTAAALQVAAQDHAAAVAADPSVVDEPRAAAQQAWREAMHAWQQLEVMQVGPAASSLTAVAGEDLRDAIYSWPTVDTCSVDRAVAEASYQADDFFVSQLVWAHGLDALEYLLFVHDAGHTCPAQVQLDGAWGALTFEQIEQRRAEYAVILADEIARQADGLAARWSPQGDDFAAALSNPGDASSPYGSDVEALDQVFAAMFYVDKQTKDGKLGLPLGLVEGCAAVPCGDLMEAPWSGEAAASVAANLSALRLMVQGGPDPATADGFDDLLEDLGEGQIATTLLSQIDAAIMVTEGFDGPLQDAIVGEPDRVVALHTAVKEVTTTLKGPFVMALLLTVPAEGAGDND